MKFKVKSTLALCNAGLASPTDPFVIFEGEPLIEKTNVEKWEEVILKYCGNAGAVVLGFKGARECAEILDRLRYDAGNAWNEVCK